MGQRNAEVTDRSGTAPIVLWAAKNLRLRVLSVIEGRCGETRFLVQKETAQGSDGVFSVRASAVSHV